MITKRKIPNLQPGQIVDLINDTTPGTVIRRVAKNLYEVQWKGHVLTLPRTHICIPRNIARRNAG